MDLIKHLHLEYATQLRENGFSEEEAQAKVNEANDFAEFARDFLRKNPPQQINYPQGGIGVTLANQVQVLIAPEDNVAASSGGMQPSVSVPVSGAETLKDMRRGEAQSRPDFEKISNPESLSRGGGPVNYKLPQPKQS